MKLVDALAIEIAFRHQAKLKPPQRAALAVAFDTIHSHAVEVTRAEVHGINDGIEMLPPYSNEPVNPEPPVTP